MPDDKALQEFSRELLALQETFGFSDGEFSGILIGSAATITQRAAIPLGHGMRIFTKCYNDAVADPDINACNDNIEKGRFGLKGLLFISAVIAVICFFILIWGLT